MIKFDSFSRMKNEVTDIEKPSLPTNIKSIFISYDGGRLSVVVNDKEVYENSGAGNDFHVEIV